MPRSDRAPSVQFYPSDFQSDPAVQAMTMEQRGRYLWAWCCSLQTDTPGIAPEDQWRRWMQFGEDEWPANREVMAGAFKIRRNGDWVQERTVIERRAQRRRRKTASSGGNARKENLSPERRTEIARNAALTRHGKQPGQADQLTPASASASASASANTKDSARTRATTPNSNGRDPLREAQDRAEARRGRQNTEQIRRQNERDQATAAPMDEDARQKLAELGIALPTPEATP